MDRYNYKGYQIILEYFVLNNLTGYTCDMSDPQEIIILYGVLSTSF